MLYTVGIGCSVISKYSRNVYPRRLALEIANSLQKQLNTNCPALGLLVNTSKIMLKMLSFQLRTDFFMVVELILFKVPIVPN